jgi:Kef-type K+ transport system membrane component KefB
MESNIVGRFLIEIAVLLITAKALGALTNRLGIGEITGELLGGLVWGPSLIKTHWPGLYAAVFPAASTVERHLLLTFCVSVGVIVLIFLSSMEIDLSADPIIVRAVTYVGGAGMVFALAAGGLLAHFVPSAYVPSGKFWGMASLLAIGVSVTTVPALARIIADNGVGKTRFGQVLLGSAIATDTVGWLLLALALALVVAGVSSVSAALAPTLKVLAVVAVMALGPRLLSPFLEARLRRFWIEPDRLFAFGAAVFLAVCAVTQLAGLNIYLGSVLYALVIGRVPVLRDAMIRGLQGFAAIVFMPLFFVNIGLSADLTILAKPEALIFFLLLLIVAAIVKIVPCYLAAKISGLREWEARTVALGMNARGGMEMVIAFAALAAGVWSIQLFTVVVILALITNVVASPTINWGLRHMVQEDRRLGGETGELAAAEVPVVGAT